jgi:hypothetical protein
VLSEDDPIGAFGLIALRFAPPLRLADFRPVAEAHGLAYAPTKHEPQLFRTPDRVEVAYGYEEITPLPPHVADLLICGADGPNAPAVLALAEALLAAWPRARWEADPGFAAILAQRAPGHRAKRRRPGR